MESSNRTSNLFNNKYTKCMRVLQMVLCVACLAIAIFLWMSLYTLTSAVIILFSTSFAFFVVTTVDVMASVNNRQYTIFVWIIMAFMAAFMFFLCFGCMILQLAVLPAFIAGINFVTGVVFLLDGIIILTRTSKSIPPNRIQPIEDQEQGNIPLPPNRIPIEDQEQVNTIVKIYIPNTTQPTGEQGQEIPEQESIETTECPLMFAHPRKSSSFPITSYGGTFPVGKNETPLPTPDELRGFSIRKNSKNSQTTRDDIENVSKNSASIQTFGSEEKSVQTFVYDLEEDDISVQDSKIPVMIGRGIQVYAPKCRECCARFSTIQEEDEYEDSSYDEIVSNSEKRKKKLRKSREIRTCICHEKTTELSRNISLETKRSEDTIQKIYSDTQGELYSTAFLKNDDIKVDISSLVSEEDRIPPRRYTKLWDVFAREKQKNPEKNDKFRMSSSINTQVDSRNFDDGKNRSIESIVVENPSGSVEEQEERRPTIDYLLEKNLIPIRKGYQRIVDPNKVGKLSDAHSENSSAAKTPTDSALDEIRAVLRESGIAADSSFRFSYDTHDSPSEPSMSKNTIITLRSWRLDSDDASAPTHKKKSEDAQCICHDEYSQYVPTILDMDKKTPTTRRPSFISFNEPESMENRKLSDRSGRVQKLEPIEEIQGNKRKISKSSAGSKAMYTDERRKRKSADSSMSKPPYYEPRNFYTPPTNKCICKCICTNNSQKRYQVYPLEQLPYHPKDNFRMPLKSFQFNRNEELNDGKFECVAQCKQKLEHKHREKYLKCLQECPACHNKTQEEKNSNNKYLQYPHTLETVDGFENTKRNNEETKNSIDEQEENFPLNLDPIIIAKIRKIEGLNGKSHEKNDYSPRFSEILEEHSVDDINIQKYPIFFPKSNTPEIKLQSFPQPKTEIPTETPTKDAPNSPQKETESSRSPETEIETATQTFAVSPYIKRKKQTIAEATDVENDSGRRYSRESTRSQTIEAGTNRRFSGEPPSSPEINAKRRYSRDSTRSDVIKAATERRLSGESSKSVGGGTSRRFSGDPLRSSVKSGTEKRFSGDPQKSVEIDGETVRFSGEIPTEAGTRLSLEPSESPETERRFSGESPRSSLKPGTKRYSGDPQRSPEIDPEKERVPRESPRSYTIEAGERRFSAEPLEPSEIEAETDRRFSGEPSRSEIEDSSAKRFSAEPLESLGMETGTGRRSFPESPRIEVGKIDTETERRFPGEPIESPGAGRRFSGEPLEFPPGTRYSGESPVSPENKAAKRKRFSIESPEFQRESRSSRESPRSHTTQRRFSGESGNAEIPTRIKGYRGRKSPDELSTSPVDTDSLECIPECSRTGDDQNEAKCSPFCPYLRKEQGTATENSGSFACLPHCPYYLKTIEKGIETEIDNSFRCLPQCSYYFENRESDNRKKFNCSPLCRRKTKSKETKKEEN